ncbi:hypothetical protein DAETH_48660 (plasmid) [Deinococcus aetherius]|uniref:Uncharacterized protein n=1 Tax=Deinococcus aetherius TaxID=200252 RepID=A0ABM8AM41_9DEIO|nr:hypothetical protein [Deinococcus aetherius]BDP44897.1 hypothetical protein DAETH_48660 [Deinococcus aetherius]
MRAVPFGERPRGVYASIPWDLEDYRAGRVLYTDLRRRLMVTAESARLNERPGLWRAAVLGLLELRRLRRQGQA